ncbi:6-bladed beta-propeller [Pedobacter sandarakinus]|uniref:6-bladed beta-propeller n=1 Tax=Pedobacter sandarakinus TaxID=353156 RepID=UPI002246870C|nr:6-bladed beta-propeller [Pedobacter sandarakinus]MCX2573767.1 6-bladed beta-propeller [Pedobacter sandarakinus]
MLISRSLAFSGLLSLTTSFAFSQTGVIDSSKTVTLRIDPQSARGASVSQVFDEVKFVPLETTKQSLFGNISQLKILGSKFLIYDHDTRSVLVFTDNGKYLTKIDATKLQTDENDKEKAVNHGFSLFKENQIEYIAIYTANNIQLFTLDGKFVKKSKKFEDFRSEESLAKGEVIIKHFAFIKTGKDSTMYSISTINKKTKDTLSYFKLPPKFFDDDDWYGEEDVNKYSDTEAFYTKYYDYKLYKLMPNKMELAYKFIFPAINTLPKDFITNPIYVKKRFEFFRNNQKILHGIGSSYLVGDCLYLRLLNVNYDKDQKKNLIYNTKTTELLSLQDLEPDSLSNFLPIIDSGLSYDFANHGFLAYENDQFYTSYSALALFTFKERNADKNIHYPALLENYFKTNDRKSNPIIIILKPRKN